jgi:predicted trehalose synthase
LAEEPLSSSAWYESVDVAGGYRVRLVLQPEALDKPSPQAWRHVAHTAPDLVVGGFFDVSWRSEANGSAVSSPALVARAVEHTSAAEVLNREATRHLRGADTADTTLALATSIGETLARAHHALATPSPEIADPLSLLGDEGAALLDRRVKDVLSEAVVLTDVDVRDTLRAHMADLRSSFSDLASASGAWVLPAVPLGSLEQFVVSGDRLAIDPLAVRTTEGPHLAVMDVARLLREVTHVAHGALRRMVSGGEHVPAERVPTWVGAVRETILERYEATLIAYGQAPLLDPRLLRAFEIEAECRALIYASRELPTWSAVPDAGLVELLTRW